MRNWPQEAPRVEEQPTDKSELVKIAVAIGVITCAVVWAQDAGILPYGT